MYDTVTQLIYGTPVGMVKAGRDVDKLISEWHKMFTLGGLLATLPWLIYPIISNPFLKPFFMPSHTNPTKMGSDHVISVRSSMT